MEYRRVGASGLKVSEICLGTMTFGHSTDAAEAARIVEVALGAGVNFFDTANNYGGGRSEEFLGAALGERRDEAVVATKFFNPYGRGPNDSGCARVSVLRAAEDSLRRLRTDWIDVYYIHHLDVQTPMEETLRAMEDLVRAGKVRYVACSNYPAWRLSEAWWIAQTSGWSKFVCYQPQYSLAVRDIEQELLPLCLHKGIGIVPWGPLAGGFLTGKYRPGQRELPGTRSEENWVWQAKAFGLNVDETLQAVLEVAGETGHTPGQVALRWVLQRPGVASVICGARTVEQFSDSLGAAGWSLPERAMERLTAVSHLPPRYPESMEKDVHLRREVGR